MDIITELDMQCITNTNEDMFMFYISCFLNQSYFISIIIILQKRFFILNQVAL